MEHWRSVVGYEGYYMVSDTGDVLSVERNITKSNGVVQHRKERLLTQRLNSDGYPVVKLSLDGKSTTIPVHRLVAMAFLENDQCKQEVNHINFIRNDNRVDNLEWVTHKENVAATKAAGRHISDILDFNGSSNPNYNNRKLKDLYSSNPELALLKQSRPGARNGRAIGVCATNIHTREMKIFDTLTNCAEHMISEGYVRANKTMSVSARIGAIIGSKHVYGEHTFSKINHLKDNTVPNQ